jgi:hypothetical protein
LMNVVNVVAWVSPSPRLEHLSYHWSEKCFTACCYTPGRCCKLSLILMLTWFLSVVSTVYNEIASSLRYSLLFWSRNLKSSMSGSSLWHYSLKSFSVVFWSMKNHVSPRSGRYNLSLAVSNAYSTLMEPIWEQWES